MAYPELAGKVVVITGGAAGPGAAMLLVLIAVEMLMQGVAQYLGWARTGAT